MIPANLIVSPAAHAALIHPNGHASDWRARPLLGESRMTSSTRLRPGCVAMEIDVRLLAETLERQQRATCTRRGLTCAESACRGMRPASSRGRDLGCRSCSAAVLGPLRSKTLLGFCAVAHPPANHIRLNCGAGLAVHPCAISPIAGEGQGVCP